MSNLAPSAIVHDKLTCEGGNYEIWRKSIKTYLMANDLWDAIDGKVEPEPGDNEGDYKTWRKKNAMALCIICTTCENGLSKYFISSEWSAKEIWDFLEKSFWQPKPASNQEENSSEQPETFVGEQQKKDIADLQKAVDTGDWSEVEKVLNHYNDLLGMGISHGKKTLLHLAVTAGHEEIVEKLLELEGMKNEVLQAQEVDGYTALAIAARGGLLNIATLLVEKNEDLVHIVTNNWELPVVLASATGHDEMTRYLYKKTDFKYLDPKNTDIPKNLIIRDPENQADENALEKFKTNAVALLTNCIAAKIYDVAMSLIQLWPSLATSLDSEGKSAAHVMAQMSTSFLGGDDFVFWKRWIYSSISVQLPPLPQPARPSTTSQPDDTESQTTKESQNVPSNCRNNRLLGKFFMFFSKFGCMKRIIKRKLRHTQALKLRQMICQEATNLEGMPKILFLAIENGLIEFVTEVFDRYPDMLWCFDEYGRNPFSFAVLQRQEKIFNLLYEMGAKKHLLVVYKDKFGNNMLHHAAMLAPPLQLRKQSGAALQFQRELHWFKEVKTVVDPKCIDARNIEGKTPLDLFTIQHDDLRKEGERWMKETASSSMIAATLIATMTFTAAFTVPGGNDQNTGLVIFLEDNPNTPRMVTPFLIFVISDALSLLSSTASVLSFLGILTTRYAQEDFRESLPRKMIFGLATLFVSMATMMVAFAATLFIVLHKRIRWVIYPIAYVVAYLYFFLFCFNLVCCLA